MMISAPFRVLNINAKFHEESDVEHRETTRRMREWLKRAV